MSFRNLFNRKDKGKGKDKEKEETVVFEDYDTVPAPELFASSRHQSSRTNKSKHKEEKKTKIGGSAIFYGEKERRFTSPFGSPRSVKERFKGLSAGHSPISSESVTPREKTSEESNDHSPRVKTKKGSLINFGSPRKKFSAWRSTTMSTLPSRIPDENKTLSDSQQDIGPSMHDRLYAEKSVGTPNVSPSTSGTYEPTQEEPMQEVTTNFSTEIDAHGERTQAESQIESGFTLSKGDNDSEFLKAYEVDVEIREENHHLIYKGIETADTDNTSTGRMESQSNTECDSLSISSESSTNVRGFEKDETGELKTSGLKTVLSRKDANESETKAISKHKYDSTGSFDRDAESGLVKITSNTSKVEYAVPARFTAEEAVNLTKQTGFRFKANDENSLAKGSFGEVSFARIYNHADYPDGTFIAIKKVGKKHLQRIAGKSSAKEMLRTEIKITSKLLKKGLAIVPTIEVVRFKKTIYQMMPIYNLTGGDIVNYIKHQRSLPEELKTVTEEDLVFLGIQIGIALADIIIGLHKVKTFHSDLKPDNILVNIKEGDVKVVLADFGSAQLLHKNNKPKIQITSVSDPIYFAPECNAIPRKNKDDGLASSKPKHKCHLLILRERWRYGLTLAQLLDPQFSEDEFLESGRMYYEETRQQRLFRYSSKIPYYNKQLEKFKNVLADNSYIPDNVAEALQGLLNPDYSEREKTSLHKVIETLKSVSQMNGSVHERTDKVDDYTNGKADTMSSTDKARLNCLLEKVLDYKNDLLEQKRVEKERLEQERIEQEKAEQLRLEQERIEQERAEKKRLALSSIHQMGKFSISKKLSSEELAEAKICHKPF